MFRQTTAMNRPPNQRSSIKLVALALAILVVALATEWLLGFRLGEAAGNLAELVMAIALIAAATMVFAPLGRSRRILASVLAFSSVVLLWAINAKFSTSLDVAYGGGYGWSGTRVAVLAVLVGPVIGLAAAILTFGLAHLRVFNRQPSTS